MLSCTTTKGDQDAADIVYQLEDLHKVHYLYNNWRLRCLFI